MDVSSIALVIVVVYVLSGIKILREDERCVVFRLGRVLPGVKGPGLIFALAPIDRAVRVSLRVERVQVTAEEVWTRDDYTVKVGAVIRFRVIDPLKAVVEVTDFTQAIRQLAEEGLRSVVGEVGVDELESRRGKLNAALQRTLEGHVAAWGIQVQSTEVARGGRF